jgi:hypothetical protein
MSIPATLSALCEMLHARTGVNVILGRPDEATSGLYVWPWLLEEDSHARNLSPAIGGGANSARQPPSQNIHFLVIAAPALTAEGLSRLDQARQALWDNPVLTVEGVTVRVTISTLETEQLAAVFQAAGIPLTLCLSATVRGVS